MLYLFSDKYITLTTGSSCINIPWGRYRPRIQHYARGGRDTRSCHFRLPGGHSLLSSAGIRRQLWPPRCPDQSGFGIGSGRVYLPHCLAVEQDGLGVLATWPEAHGVGNFTAGRGGQYVTSPDFTPPGPPKKPRSTPGIHHQINGPAMVWLPLPCYCRGQVLCVAPLQVKPDSVQQGPASDGLQEDGGNKQMGHEQMGGGPAPQPTKPGRGK